jgi:hypothetical protein
VTTGTRRRRRSRMKRAQAPRPVHAPRRRAHAGHGCQTRARIAAAAIARELAVLSRRCTAPARITRYPLRCQSPFLAPHVAPVFPHESAVNDVFSMGEPATGRCPLFVGLVMIDASKSNPRCDDCYSRSATFLPLESAAPPGHGRQRGRRR